jgi:hypothetical protein
MDFEPGGLKYHIRTDSLDPQTALDLKYPIDLTSKYPGHPVVLLTAAFNAALLILEWLLLVWEPGFRIAQKVVEALNFKAFLLAERFSDPAFIQFDRTASWFYSVCVFLFVFAVLLDLNGSSIGVDWINYKVGAPSRVIVGTPQQIRADEIYYQTPYMMNQYFRRNPFQVADTASGSSNVGLLAELPVKHVTTWFRPQFWPFFLLRDDYAFSAWWQAKGLIMATGVFTFLLLITGSSRLSIVGTLWLLLSQFTQWCYSWPSMLPEMCGLLCFTVVLTLYLTVGRNPIALAMSALCGAACAINFALTAYVPHQIPYVWAGLFIAAAWIVAHRTEILRRDVRSRQAIAICALLAVTGMVLVVILKDTKDAVAGIAATVYPGHRVMSGGAFSLTAFATRFLAASETASRFPPEYSNINEASGFMWLAPVTLLGFAKMRGLNRDRRILMGGLWTIAILLMSWMVLPIPASVGHFMFLDRVQGVRVLPALGLLNVCIVMLFLSGKDHNQNLAFAAKLIVALPIILMFLFSANRNIHDYFGFPELVLGGFWACSAGLLMIERRRLLFAAVVVIPNVFLFGAVNPFERGIDTITRSNLFETVQHNKSLKQGKWIVFSDGFPASIFSAVGCDVFNGMRYLPDLQSFPVLAAHGVDTRLLNNLGYVDIEQAELGKPPLARKGPYGSILSVSPLDPLLKQLGIRYLAFHNLPSQDVRNGLTPLTDGTVSEFWIYELK